MQFALLGPSAGYVVGKNVDNRQRQLNVVDGLSVAKASHLLKAGVDYRRLSPVLDVLNYGEGAFFASGASGALAGQAAFVNITSTPLPRHPIFNNVSAYVQDAWHVSPRITLTAGVRWEMNPPPSEANGNLAYTVAGLEHPATMTLAPLGTPLWQTTYGNFAPRIGAAWQVSSESGLETVVRAGAGTFYDLGTGPIGGAFVQTAFPYFSGKSLFNVPFPLDSVTVQPGPITAAPPYQGLVVADPHLALPRVYEWSLTVEQALGAAHSVSLSYVGAAGRRLLRDETLAAPNPDFGNVLLVRNAASSDYQALQMQYRHPLAHGVQALASYTLAQSLDNVSNESFALIPASLVDPTRDRGPSDFDIRHSVSAAVTYLMPAAGDDRRFSALRRGWSFDAIVRARSAAPVNVAQGALLGVQETGRPDLIPGVPVYLEDPTVPGGKRINSAAFATPALNAQGSLPRNALRGFTVSQIDVSLRRQFRLPRSRNVEVGADVFNVLNRPNFADPEGFLDDGPAFGKSNAMFGKGVGGLNSLYQLGGPRSVQLSVRVKM